MQRVDCFNLRHYDNNSDNNEIPNDGIDIINFAMFRKRKFDDESQDLEMKTTEGGDSTRPEVSSLKFNLLRKHRKTIINHYYCDNRARRASEVKGGPDGMCIGWVGAEKRHPAGRLALAESTG
jgi:hypothetical protein